MTETPHWYPSKIDWWLAVLLAFAPLMCVAATVGTLLAGDGVIVALGASAFLALVYVGLVLPMRYCITNDAIVVRHGLIRQQIPLREITEVYPTRSPLSSPALSLDRLHIQFGEGFFKAAMISPDDKEKFLTELATRTGMRREGERLVRSL